MNRLTRRFPPTGFLGHGRAPLPNAAVDRLPFIEASMFEDRDIRIDVASILLLMVAAFLGLALLTHNAADPPVQMVSPFNRLYQPDVLSYPVASETTNACGPWGSVVSSAMFDAFGVGAFYIVGSMAALGVFLLWNYEIDSPILRTFGWLASLAGITSLATLIVPSLSPGTVIGSGGMFGALIGGSLEYYFAGIGGCILALSILVGGLLLCTDYVLVHLGLMLGGLTIAGFRGHGLKIPARNLSVGNHDEEDVGGEELEGEETEDELAVRVGGRRIKLHQAEDLEDDEEYEEDYDDSDDEYDDVAESEVAEDDDEDDLDDEDYDEEEVAEEDVAEDEEPDEVPVRTPSDKSKTPEETTALMRSGRGERRRLTPFRVRRPPEPEDRDAVMEQLDAADAIEGNSNYQLPSLEILHQSDDFNYDDQAKEVRRKAKVLEKSFKNFNINIKVVDIECGPVIAQYEIELEKGLRLSKITGLADDIAIALRVPSVRIVAPIPGKNTVGIEVPNEERQLVRLRDVMEESKSRIGKMNIPVFLGKDVSGNALVSDLSKLPHLLIAGRTGTGKSVCLNAIISSILMTRGPDEVRMLMIDPKMVELSGYKTLPHLMHPVVTDMRKAEAILAWAVEKMEERYSMLAQAGVRHVTSYNQLSQEELMDRFDPQTEEERKAIPLQMPFIVIVADEMADLMMTAGKEVEQHIIRLAQKSRAVGIHLILATQKPTVDVITGLIKSNLPARLAFQVASRTDSRVVLDEQGADKLLGNGDMLFLSPGTSTLMRGQGTFLADDEINTIVAAASQGEQRFVKELVHLKVEEENESAKDGKKLRKRDDVYEDAIEVVVREGRGSCSLLQRALGIGYGRAARLIDFMAEDGIVGAYNGSQAREVLMSMAEYQSMIADDGEAEEVAELAPKVEKAKPKAKGKSAAKLKSAPTLAAAVADVDLESEEDEEAIISEIAAEVKSATAVVKGHGDSNPPKVAPPANDEADELEDEDEYEYVYEDEDGNEVNVDEDDEEYEYVYEDEDGDEEYEYEDEELEESA